MDLEGIYLVIAYCRDHVSVAVAAGIVLALLIYKKPKFFFTVLFFGLLLVGVLYMITYVSTAGVEHKEGMLSRHEILSQ